MMSYISKQEDPAASAASDCPFVITSGCHHTSFDILFKLKSRTEAVMSLTAAEKVYVQIKTLRRSRLYFWPVPRQTQPTGDRFLLGAPLNDHLWNQHNFKWQNLPSVKNTTTKLTLYIIIIIIITGHLHNDLAKDWDCLHGKIWFRSNWSFSRFHNIRPSFLDAN